jgi:hypothetical protein
MANGMGPPAPVLKEVGGWGVKRDLAGKRAVGSSSRLDSIDSLCPPKRYDHLGPIAGFPLQSSCVIAICVFLLRMT